MQLYYITDRAQFPGDEIHRQQQLLAKIAEAAHAGVNYIQLREKDLTGRDLETLARKAKAAIGTNSRTTLLINSRTDIAIATGADGVHLRSTDISPAAVRKIWTQCGADTPVRAQPKAIPTVAISCHTLKEVEQAANEKADFAIFGPIFEKRAVPEVSPTGVEALRQVCRLNIPVFAIGGITLENALACMDAGATGIAAIRLFQENSIVEIVQKLQG